jgi:hypothetical protein
MICERCNKKFERKRKKGTRRNNAKICPECKEIALNIRIFKKIKEAKAKKKILKKNIIAEPKIRVRLRRPCSNCGEMYIPTGSAETLCKDCFKTARSRIKIRRKKK